MFLSALIRDRDVAYLTRRRWACGDQIGDGCLTVIVCLEHSAARCTRVATGGKHYWQILTRVEEKWCLSGIQPFPMMLALERYTHAVSAGWLWEGRFAVVSNIEQG